MKKTSVVFTMPEFQKIPKNSYILLKHRKNILKNLLVEIRIWYS